jgi:hypothetical protein
VGLLRQADVDFGKGANLLLQCPESFSEKIEKVIRLHHRTDKPPADAAAFMARLLKPRLKFLIVGQSDDSSA